MTFRRRWNSAGHLDRLRIESTCRDRIVRTDFDKGDKDVEQQMCAGERIR